MTVTMIQLFVRTCGAACIIVDPIVQHDSYAIGRIEEEGTVFRMQMVERPSALFE
jgi:hypothetical protein